MTTPRYSKVPESSLLSSIFGKVWSLNGLELDCYTCSPLFVLVLLSYSKNVILFWLQETNVGSEKQELLTAIDKLQQDLDRQVDLPLFI